MTMNDDDFARKIKGYLDRNTSELKQGTTYRLQQARARALERVGRTEAVSQLTLAGAHGIGGVGSGMGTPDHGRRFWTNRVLWAGIVVILAGGLALNHWRQLQQVREIEETDAAILSSELPIDAYLDKGFQNWLKFGGE